MDVSNLTGVDLDVAVAIAEGFPAEKRDGRVFFGGIWNRSVGYCPSEEWGEGGPIIERERIELSPPRLGAGDWFASKATRDRADDKVVHGATPLIAAMRAFVASKQDVAARSAGRGTATQNAGTAT